MADSGKKITPDCSGRHSSQSLTESSHKDGEGKSGVDTDDKCGTGGMAYNVTYPSKVPNTKGDCPAVNPDNAQSTSRHAANSTETGGQNKNKNEIGKFVSNRQQNFSGGPTVTSQPQQDQKTTNKDKSLPTEMVSDGSNTPKPSINEGNTHLQDDLKHDEGGQKPKKTLKDAIASTCSKSEKGEALSKSFVVVTEDGLDKIALNVKTSTEKSSKIYAALNDTVKEIMKKIEQTFNVRVENQRLVVNGRVLLEDDTLLSHNITHGSTIHLIVSGETGSENKEIDSDKASAPTTPKIAETSVSTEQCKKESGKTPTQTEVSGSSGIPEQDEKGRKMVINQPEQSHADNLEYEQPASGKASQNLEYEQPASGKASQENKADNPDGKLKEEKGEQDQLMASVTKTKFTKSVKVIETRQNQTTNPTEVLKGDNAGVFDKNHEEETYLKKGDGKEVKVKSEDDMAKESVLKDDVPNVDKDIEDDEEDGFKTKHFTNDLEMGDENSKENTKEESLKMNDEAQQEAHLSESSSVETISGEDQEEPVVQETGTFMSLKVSIAPNIKDDGKTEDNSDRFQPSSPSTSDFTGAVKDVDIPNTCSAEHKVYGKPSVDDVEKTEMQKEVQDLPIYKIVKLRNNYMLYQQNNLVAKLPQLKEASDVSVDGNIIFIGDDPKYEINIFNGKVKLTKVESAENEDTKTDISTDDCATKLNEQSEECQQQSKHFKDTGSKKVRGKTPGKQDVLYAEDGTETGLVSQQDSLTEVDDKGQNLAGAAVVTGAVGSKDVDDLINKIGKMSITDGKQQQNVEEGGSMEKKPPIPAPRKKTRENETEDVNESQKSLSPTPPPRARKGSQDQGAKIKTQAPESQTTQPVCRSVPFRIKYKLMNDPEIKEREAKKQMTQSDHMKWKFAAKDLKLQHEKLQNYSFEGNEDLIVVNIIGHVKETSELKAHIANILELLNEHSKNCTVREISFQPTVRGEEIQNAIALHEYRDVLYTEVDNEDLYMTMVCHSSFADRIEAEIKQEISKLAAGRNHYTFEIIPVFRKRLQKEPFEHTWKQRFPLVEMRKKYIPDNHRFAVTLVGPKQKIEEAKSMLDSINSCNEISFNDVGHSKVFDNIVDVLNEFFRLFSAGKDVLFDINKEKEKIGISTSSTRDTDIVTNDVKKCIKTKKISSERDQEKLVREIEDAVDEPHKPYIRITIEKENSLKVYGLEHHLNSCLKAIGEIANAQKIVGPSLLTPSGVADHQAMDLESVEETIRIDDPLVYECISKHINFSTIARKGKVKIEPQGFVLKGLKGDVALIRRDIEQLEKSIVSKTIDFVVQADHKVQLDENLHQLERNSNIIVKKKEAKEGTVWYDFEKVQWIFTQGHTVEIARTCLSADKKILVKFEENTEKANQKPCYHGGDFVVYVPKWNDGKSKETTLLSENFNACLQECVKRSFQHIDIIIGQVSWRMQKFVKQLLPELNKMLTHESPLCICFLGSNQKTCEDIYKACYGLFRVGLPSVKPDEKGVNVTIVKDDLAETKADVLVNTIDDSGSLTQGAIAKSLFEKAGQKLQDELKKQFPIKRMKIHRTKAYIRDCKHIFHGCLNFYTKSSRSKEDLSKFVLDCLIEAENCECSSIAFPALGAGNLRYPLHEVIAAMFDAVEEFNKLRKSGSSVQEVKFVLFDPTSAKKFEEECRKRGMKKSDVTDCHKYGQISLRAEKGTLSDIKQDCILYLWDRSVIRDARADQYRHVILQELDETSRKKWLDKMFPAHGVASETFYTPKFKNINSKNVIHVPYEDNQTAKEKAVSSGLKMAMTLKKQSVGLYFDNAHPFLRGGTYMTSVASGVSDASDTAPPLDVVVFVGQNFFNKAETFFKENTQMATPAKNTVPQHETENIVMTVVGTKQDVATAVDTFRKQKAIIVMEVHSPQKYVPPKPVMPGAPEEMCMERGLADDIPDSKAKLPSPSSIWTPECLERNEELDCYVEVLNIPKGLNMDKLKIKIFDLHLQIVFPDLVYCDGSTNALMICKSVEDAKQLENVQTPMFKFRLYGTKKAFSKLSKFLDSRVWNIAKAKNLLPKIKDKLKKIHVTLVDEETLKIETVTPYQIKCAEEILAQYDDQTVRKRKESSDDEEGFINLKKYETFQVAEDVWDIVSEICKDDIGLFEKDFGPIKFQNSEVAIPAHNGEIAESVVQKLKTNVAGLSKKEINEVVFDKKKVKKSNMHDYCKQVEETFGYDCCVWIQAKQKLYAYDDTYDNVQKIKHTFNLKSGQIKQTARSRGNRTGANIQVNDKSDFEKGALSETPDNRLEQPVKETTVYNSNTEKSYKFGNTTVKVYKGNILDLPVDCIVNAANQSLSHGGGVAEVIARAAGNELTKEGNDYIREHGEIPVGQACATTAGKLKYECVIHTVGPSWYKYDRHSLRDVEKCKDDLYHAVYNCFTIAEKRQLRSIAIPAISSAIFGVPIDICVEQYARATISYCMKAVDAPAALTEIHFIDIKPKTVSKIQEMFDVKEREGIHVGSFYGEAASASSAAPRLEEGEETNELPEPLTYEEGWKCNVFCFLETERLIVSYRQDILSVKSKGIVVSVNNKGKGGSVGEAVFKNIPQEYSQSFKKSLSGKINNFTKIGHVVVNDGYGCGYPFILLVVYPFEARRKSQHEREDDLVKAYGNIFLAARERKIPSVVTTFFGIDSSSDSEVQFGAKCFLDSYIAYCKEKKISRNSSSLELTIVCQSEHNYDLVCEVFQEYVQGQKKLDQSIREDPKAEIKESAEELGDCVICMDEITEPKHLDCGHTFCTACIEQHFTFVQKCPTCGHVCGKITGDQPDGNMDVTVHQYMHLTGYNTCGTITITYSFRDGKQGKDHPNPGKFYKGIHRQAYLPDNSEGRKIAKMLKVAFDRRLVFTIGNSRTTGQEGVITWNDIHHKTDRRPNTQFGYPDATYMERVTEELAVKGVTEKDIVGVTL